MIGTNTLRLCVLHSRLQPILAKPLDLPSPTPTAVARCFPLSTPRSSRSPTRSRSCWSDSRWPTYALPSWRQVWCDACDACGLSPENSLACACSLPAPLTLCNRNCRERFPESATFAGKSGGKFGGLHVSGPRRHRLQRQRRRPLPPTRGQPSRRGFVYSFACRPKSRLGSHRMAFPTPESSPQ
jgi:hypothetical protein